MIKKYNDQQMIERLAKKRMPVFFCVCVFFLFFLVEEKEMKLFKLIVKKDGYSYGGRQLPAES